MALITKLATADMDVSTARKAAQLSGDFLAGEALGNCAACYVKASDGKVYQSNGTANTEPAKFDGFTAKAHNIGEPVTLISNGVRIGNYAAGMTIGQKLYVAATAGALDTATTTGGLTEIARATSATDIRCIVTAA